MTIQYLKLEIFIPATHFRILQKHSNRRTPGI